MKITVIGAGAFGISMAYRMKSNRENDITIWSESQAKIDEYNDTRSIPEVLKGKPLPAGFNFTTSMEEAVSGAELVFMLTASQYVRSICEQAKPFLSDDAYPIVGSKGVCPDGSIPANAAIEVLGRDCAVIAGPGFAEDIIVDCPVGLTLATVDDAVYDKVRNAFSHDRLVVIDRSRDPRGVSLCSCMKNAAAVACGALHGAGHPESTVCLLMQRVINDLSRITAGLESGDERTPFELAGIGDLILTCFSPKSRNGSFGRIVGKHGYGSVEAKEFLANNTVEGMAVVAQWKTMADKAGIRSEFMDMMSQVFCEDGDMVKMIDFILG